MFTRIRATLKELRVNTSGNAMLMMAMGMPALVGGAGLSVDVAQWYIWKRELQFAVDQAALAGAWAKASQVTAVQGTYAQMALNAYNNNIGNVGNFDAAAGPTISIVNYDTGTNNAIQVASSATQQLPFSSVLTSSATTVSVSAKAIWYSSTDFHACMLALSPHAAKAFEMGGSVTGSSTCGAGALSDDTSSNGSMKKLGTNSTQLGTLVSAGKIDANFAANGVVYQNQEGLSNPYSDVALPSSSGQSSYTYPTTCPVAAPASTTYSATGTRVTFNTYKYFKGNDRTLLTNYTGTGYIPDSQTPPEAFPAKSVTITTTAGIQPKTTAAAGAESKVYDTNGNANDIYRLPYTATQDTINNIETIHTPATDGLVHLSPGIYPALNINCASVLSPGVYFVGGGLSFGTQPVTATGGVMFMLTGGNSTVTIDDNAKATLSGISTQTLEGSPYLMSSENAAKLDGMLIYDPDSTADIRVNGNSALHLSGVLYMPKRSATFNGDATATPPTGNCMMVAVNILKLTGNFSLNNFCVSTGGSGMSIGGTVASVKLVS